ncbi:MAG TPA: DNA-processing protein DprA [Solirubrobacteraceae bacterium]|nr:DNA-processing protein DprA [Solirubrobacteraceae bacterium]
MTTPTDCGPNTPTLSVAGTHERLQQLLARPVVAIVGSRYSTYYGQETAATLARELAQAGVTIVAGLTEGIEASAHHAVLQAGKPTIAVVPGSPLIPYPHGQKHLHAKILERGCAVGAAQAQTLKQRSQHRGHSLQDPLLKRNSLIAELAQLVILIEATTGAVAMQTAETALELGREVAAVPGRITDESARGPNRLIREGAHPILETKDAIDLLACPYSDKPTRTGRALK